jgi:anaerobic selenocysteine-containing dehydrogenase
MLNNFGITFPYGMGDETAQSIPIVSLETLFSSFDNPDAQQYKAIIWTYSNPLLNWPSRQMWRDQIFPHMELIVQCDFRMTETCDLADYVLPDVTPYEREEIIEGVGNALILQEPAVPPFGQARNSAEIWSDLGRRLGKPELFQNTVEEWNKIRLEGAEDPLISEANPPITYERLKREKIIKLGAPDRIFDYFLDRDLQTQSGRFEFYKENYADIDAALTDYYPALIDDSERRKKYPLQFFNGRSRFFMQGQFREIPELRTLAGGGPRATMNPHDALERGINDGDTVEIFNEQGAVTVPVYFSHHTQRGCVHILYAWKYDDYEDGNPPQVLQTDASRIKTYDKVATRFSDIMIAGGKANGIPPTLNYHCGYGVNECLWDELCDVRKKQ